MCPRTNPYVRGRQIRLPRTWSPSSSMAVRRAFTAATCAGLKRCGVRLLGKGDVSHHVRDDTKMISAVGDIPRYRILGWCRRSRSNLCVMRSCILVRWRLSRACTPRASVQSKRSCIAPWTKHALRSESCACASGSRKRPHLSRILTSRTFGGYGHQLNELETGVDAIHSPRSFAALLPFSLRLGFP